MQQYHFKNRPNRELTSKEEIHVILFAGKYTSISLCRENEPYIVTLSYGFDPDKNCLYLHCAQQGLKIDFLNANKRVCATVIHDGGYLHDQCAHKYKTVVFWGDLHIVEELQEKKHGMNILTKHLEEKESVVKEMMLKSDDYYHKKMEILRLDITEIHGKAGQ